MLCGDPEGLTGYGWEEGAIGRGYMHAYIYIYTAAATAAKSLQSCPTLCDPIDGSPPGLSVPGILQARILEWVAISFSNIHKHTHITDSLHCIAETNTTLYSNYTPINTLGDGLEFLPKLYSNRQFSNHFFPCY